jgi:hypothetical protein
MVGDSVVWQEKYPIENGIVSGHVFVQDSLRDGDYCLEAYTRRSFYADSTEMSAVKKVKIVRNINKSERNAFPVKDSSFRFETFPEGGNLIAGIPCRLAFKATDGRGYPVEIRGALYENDVQLVEIQSTHAGMGSVRFTPAQDRTYHIKLENGESYPLPEIYAQGMTLRLSGWDSSHVELTVSQQSGQPRMFYLTGQLRGTVCCVARGMLHDSLKVRLPLDEFPGQGIAVITLYDENLLPVAERLAYVHSEKKLYITATTEKKNYLTREKVTVKIKSTDEAGNPVPAHLGISVYDPYYDNPEAPLNILAYCHLTSQIRGRIYNPGYYFDEKNANRMEAMDLLLLTQGWRRCIWQADSPASRGQAVVGDEITGIQTVRKRKQKDAVLQLVKVSDANENAQFVTVDSAGNFAIDAGLMRTLNPGYLYLKPMLPEEFKPELNMNDPFEVIGQARKTKDIFYPVACPDESSESAEERPPVISQDIILLDEVTITGKSHKPIRDRYMGRLDSLMQMNLGPWVCDCTPSGYLENYREGYTHHPHGSYSGQKRLPVIGKTYEIIKYKDVGQYWVVADIKYIVYNGPDYSDEELLQMNGLWRVKGYYGVREFYHPDEIDMQSSLPDARNTLFWSPAVVTDENGEATVSFYCSDLNTGFTGHIEGTNGTGLIGMSAFDFRVLKVPVFGKEDK